MMHFEQKYKCLETPLAKLTLGARLQPTHKIYSPTVSFVLHFPTPTPTKDPGIVTGQGLEKVDYIFFKGIAGIPQIYPRMLSLTTYRLKCKLEKKNAVKIVIFIGQFFFLLFSKIREFQWFSFLYLQFHMMPPWVLGPIIA